MAEEEEYRTSNDIWKEIARGYTDLGKLLDELNRMEKKEATIKDGNY